MKNIYLLLIGLSILVPSLGAAPSADLSSRSQLAITPVLPRIDMRSTIFNPYDGSVLFPGKIAAAAQYAPKPIEPGAAVGSSGEQPAAELPSFDAVWSTQDPDGIALLRMVGLIEKKDWERLGDEEKELVLRSFNSSARLTQFGKTLLEELKGAKLYDPNEYPQNTKHDNKPLLISDLGTESVLREYAGATDGSSLMRIARHPFTNSANSAPLIAPHSFDWEDFSADTYMAASLDQKPHDEAQESDTIRILVSPKHRLTESRYKINEEKDHKAIANTMLSQSGINEDLLESHDAQLIHALSVFNVVVLEVKKGDAVKLAKALELDGHFSRPVSNFQLMSVPRPAPPMQNPGFFSGLAPFIRTGLSKAVSAAGKSGLPVAGRFKPMLSESVALLKPNKFYADGIKGKRSVAVIVDTGLDITHQDFGGRTVIVKDFTSDNDNKDYIGHGTHVASTALGSGKASNGKYSGVAPETDTVIAAKVFGQNSFTGEDTILAGLDWGVKMAGADKAVINMSLGGRGTPNDVLSRAANMLAHQGHAINVAAGNSGPRKGTVGSPGLARDAKTIGATDKNMLITDYSSRGRESGYQTPANGVWYSKPDLAFPGGGVTLSWTNKLKSLIGLASPDIEFPCAQGNCPYGTGIIAAKSSDMAPGACDVDVNGKPLYTKMSGTSMATPHAAGVDMLVFDYLKREGALTDTSFLESKAAQMEAAKLLTDEDGDIYGREVQGAGMPDLDRLYDLISSRTKLGLPIGNISAEIAYWASADEELAWKIRKDSSYRITSIGIVSAQTGKVINSDKELKELIDTIDAHSTKRSFYVKARKRFDWWVYRLTGRDLRKDGTQDLLKA
ncbi:S8 family serine peptidase [Elusimicrobiota bacterium]